MPSSDFLILDTHVWLWLLLGDARIKKASVSSKIIKAGSNASLGVSSISIREIAMLESKGRISLSMDITAWIDKALGMPGLQMLPLSPAISINSTRLPGAFHGDPADRIIVATARDRNGTLVTADRQIIEYARTTGNVNLLEIV